MKLSAFLLALLIAFGCTACGWQLRNPGEIPPQLKRLYLNGENLDSHFKVHLVNLLQSSKIFLVPGPGAAPLTLNVYDYKLTHNNPPVASTNVPITYTYILKVKVSISNAAGKIVVPPRLIVSTRNITVNTNQIFTINSTSIFQEELQREAINLIYYWMTSDQTRSYLHAAKSSAT